ncbi:hypothetical protein [Fodinibius sediminis]|uniref:Rod binding protein n=1 Tax=Fodinibius sediminis TaxID=1214077 RepID=A0A521CHD8_9BACT|nr:hypothetical protein [Fodinibius sediminis]SMO58765.1 hypothetical protein SAMN06265218_10686 [Fodinibius sediminis]
MTIENSPVYPNHLSTEKNGSRESPREIGAKFEQLFARQLVQEMTKGLFKNDDKQSMIGNAGSGLYRQHIIDTLSKELARHQDLGIGKQIAQYLNQKEQ